MEQGGEMDEARWRVGWNRMERRMEKDGEMDGAGWRDGRSRMERWKELIGVNFQ